MDISAISPGKNPPWDIHVVVEVPIGSDPVKYELDKESGALYVDRFLHTSMFYPCNYGFVPHTLSKDGDPIDVLIAGQIPVLPGSVLPARPVGVLMMEDEQGPDEKILSVPNDELAPDYGGITSYRELPRVLLDKIAHFFQHYKDLEQGKWVTIKRWGEADEAYRRIEEALERDGKS